MSANCRQSEPTIPVSLHRCGYRVEDDGRRLNVVLLGQGDDEIARSRLCVLEGTSPAAAVDRGRLHTIAQEMADYLTHSPDSAKDAAALRWVTRRLTEFVEDNRFAVAGYTFVATGHDYQGVFHLYEADASDHWLCVRGTRVTEVLSPREVDKLLED